MLWLSLIAASILPQPDGVLRDSCCRLERNSVYGGDGRLVFCQIIAWDDERVFFWRKADDGSLPVERDHRNGGWVLMWLDGDIPREVRASSYEESWTQYDPELADREFLPQEQRRKLKSKH